MSEQNAEYGRPVLLDLFCGAGGAAMGYHRAGFDVVGVDIAPQPHYPFKFEQADAMTWPLDGYDAIHASPPCQAHSLLTYAARTREQHPDLLTPTRSRLRDSGLAYVIENVPGAPMLNYITLCGTSFGLVAPGWELWRHRQFEANWPWPVLLPGCAHRQRALVAGVYGGGGYVAPAERKHGKSSSAAVRRQVMGIDWMNRCELSQAIPPAYTEFVGRQLFQAIMAERAVTSANRPAHIARSGQT